MRTFLCIGCGMTDVAETFADLQAEGWNHRTILEDVPGRLDKKRRTLHFCGDDCREYVLDEMGIPDFLVTVAQEKAMRPAPGDADY